MTDGQWALRRRCFRRRGAPAALAQARELGPSPDPGRDLVSGPRPDRPARPCRPDFPPQQTVCALFRRRTRARAWCWIYAALRERVRLVNGRGPLPTGAYRAPQLLGLVTLQRFGLGAPGIAF
jgi:hypothetical protein